MLGILHSKSVLSVYSKKENIVLNRKSVIAIGAIVGAFLFNDGSSAEAQDKPQEKARIAIMDIQASAMK